MYGRYREDLGQFALTEARKNSITGSSGIATVTTPPTVKILDEQEKASHTSKTREKKSCSCKIKRTLAGT